MDTSAAATVEDYRRITREGDRRELVDGVILVNDAPKLNHGVVQARLLSVLVAWVEAADGRGMAIDTANVELDEHNLFNPDALWIAERHLPASLDGDPDLVPDICVEIRSPTTWHRDRVEKRDAYERGGCPELWLVDHVERQVLVHRRSRPDPATFDVELVVEHELTSPQLPGFALSLERLFRDL